jgi:hypothetical protein
MTDEIKQWVKAAGIRAIKTAAQAAVAIIGTSTAMGGVDWALCGSAALLAGILSVLTSVAGIPEVGDGASVGKLGA